MDTVIIVLIIVLVVIYFLSHIQNQATSLYSQSKKALELFSANYRDQPNYAPTNYNENIAGINEAAVKNITINDYANNLAYNPRDPNSANYLVQGRRPWSPNGYPHLGNADGQDGGRQFSK